MTLSPVQIKVLTYGGAVVLLWLLARNAKAATPGRVTSELEIDANVNSPTFGLTFAEIAAMNRNSANPAINQTMRDLIDRSNAAIAADDRENGDVTAVGP